MRSRLHGAANRIAVRIVPVARFIEDRSRRGYGMDLHKGWKVGPPHPEFELSMPSEISAISPFVDQFMERLKPYTCYKGFMATRKIPINEST
jgi:hypothetical protein